jgi:hypothetical protein
MRSHCNRLNDHSNLDNSVVLVCERNISTERSPLVGQVSAKFYGWRVSRVSAKDLYGRILGFLNRNRYFFFQVALQLYSRG